MQITHLAVEPRQCSGTTTTTPQSTGHHRLRRIFQSSFLLVLASIFPTQLPVAYLWTNRESTFRQAFISFREFRCHSNQQHTHVVNLYTTNDKLIVPATRQQACSYVELVSTVVEDQRPEWFVSHRWREPVLQFVTCLKEFARLRGQRTRANKSSGNNAVELKRVTHSTSWSRSLL